MSFFDAKSSTLQIILVRPGATELDLQGRITGTLDIPLCPQGENQARDVAVALKDVDVEAIYSAPCMAAQETARVLAKAGGSKIRIEENLLNLDHGLWHGKLVEELRTTQPKVYKQWLENPESICPPGGETVESVRKRVAQSLKKICRKHKQGRIIIVGPEPLGSILVSELIGNRNCDVLSAQLPYGGWKAVDVPVGAFA